ncbi:MAG: crotonase/enoyl-CoA hydratase family protein [Myxococcota bacterium]
MAAVELHIEGAIATLTMNVPERRNAMGPAFFEELPARIHQIDAAEGVRVVILKAEGKSFSAGLDLMAMVPKMPVSLQPEPPDGAKRAALHRFIEQLQYAITSVARCRVPIVAAVHGACVGGGVDLVTACDLCVASEDAYFSVREARVGIVADLGTLQRLPRIIGEGRARNWVFTARDVPAAEAERAGLVQQVFSDQDAMLAGAHALATEIASRAPLAVQGSKAVMVEQARHEIDRSLAYVAAWNTAHLMNQDLGRAMQAFVTKTEPSFEGN